MYNVIRDKEITQISNIKSGGKAMREVQTNDLEKRLDITYEILCLIAVKFNKSFPHDYHKELANKYSLTKLNNTYQLLQAV